MLISNIYSNLFTFGVFGCFLGLLVTKKESLTPTFFVVIIESFLIFSLSFSSFSFLKSFSNFNIESCDLFISRIVSL